MAQEKKAPGGPERKPQQGAETRLVTIKFSELPDPGKEADEYGNRSLPQYQEEANGELLESIRLHGLLDPPFVVKGQDGKWRIVGGHRRVAMLYVLARRNVPKFSMDMPVQCLELVDASPLELVIRSIAGNELAKKLEPKDRLLAVKKASAAGATKKEIAATVGVSEKAIDRDLKIVKNARVLRHVLDDNLSPTAASTLVAVAADKGRLDDFLDHLNGWVERTRHQIQEEDRRVKEEGRRPLRPNQTLVANRLEAHLVRGWIDAMAKGRPLTEEPDLGFEAAFDKATAVATIRLKIDARNDDPARVARVAGQVSQIAKHLAAFAKKRRELEGPGGPQAALQKDGLLDTELLKQFGLVDVASQLDQDSRAEERPSEEGAKEENEVTEDEE
jgi:ParB-like chromosome segregation protein Spo0J